jgi:UTP-glucose-1-phosphate uridylyltransferase
VLIDKRYHPSGLHKRYLLKEEIFFLLKEMAHTKGDRNQAINLAKVDFHNQDFQKSP